MRETLENLFQDNPTKFVLAAASGTAVLLSLFMGFSRGAFSPSITQSRIEDAQQANELRKQLINIANDRYDAGCEGVFYFKTGKDTYQPLTEGSGVISGEFWRKWTKNNKLKPNKTDYLPAGTTVCDVYGNVGTLVSNKEKGYATVAELLNTPDQKRITAMMKRYPTANRPQVGS